MKRTLRTFYTAAVCLAAPTFAKPALLNLAGHRVHRSARIGMSLIRRTRLYLGAGAVIGPFNLIACRRLILRESAAIGSMNMIKGQVAVRLGPRAELGNRNVALSTSDHSWPAHLVLGELTKITSGHYIECSESVVWGRFGTLAGVGSQIWTHGFVHAETGPDRAFIRGRVRVGDNVYIGARSVIGAGVHIADAIAVGAHSSIASDLTEAGVYVSAPLRHIARAPDERLARLGRLPDGSYWKGPRPPKG